MGPQCNDFCTACFQWCVVSSDSPSSVPLGNNCHLRNGSVFSVMMHFLVLGKRGATWNIMYFRWLAEVRSVTHVPSPFVSFEISVGFLIKGVICRIVNCWVQYWRFGFPWLYWVYTDVLACWSSTANPKHQYATWKWDLMSFTVITQRVLYKDRRKPILFDLSMANLKTKLWWFLKCVVRSSSLYLIDI